MKVHAVCTALPDHAACGHALSCMLLCTVEVCSNKAYLPVLAGDSPECAIRPAGSRYVNLAKSSQALYV